VVHRELSLFVLRGKSNVAFIVAEWTEPTKQHFLVKPTS